VIGILAGMGPKSTAPFVEKVVEQCQVRYGAKNDDDFPPMMIFSCPTPFYIDRPIDQQAMKTAIISGVKKLASTGVDFIAIPCNSAHVYFEDIRKCTKVPVLNIVEETVRCLPQDSNKVAILGTAATIESEIYQNGLAKIDVEYVYERQWQEHVNQVISMIKSNVRMHDVRRVWQELLDIMAARVSTVILACTDLNAVSGSTESSLQMIDSAECLARAVVDRHYRRVLKIGKPPCR
jgi:aspartate racemase